MASETFVQPTIPRFDGHYDHWNMLMENFLRSKEYWHVVSEGITEPTDNATMTQAQRTELDGQRLKDLRQRIIFSKQLIAQSWKPFFAKTLRNIFGIP